MTANTRIIQTEASRKIAIAGAALALVAAGILTVLVVESDGLTARALDGRADPRPDVFPGDAVAADPHAAPDAPHAGGREVAGEADASSYTGADRARASYGFSIEIDDEPGAPSFYLEVEYYAIGFRDAEPSVQEPAGTAAAPDGEELAGSASEATPPQPSAPAGAPRVQREDPLLPPAPEPELSDQGDGTIPNAEYEYSASDAGADTGSNGTYAPARNDTYVGTTPAVEPREVCAVDACHQATTVPGTGDAEGPDEHVCVDTGGNYLYDGETCVTHEGEGVGGTEPVIVPPLCSLAPEACVSTPEVPEPEIWIPGNGPIQVLPPWSVQANVTGVEIGLDTQDEDQQVEGRRVGVDEAYVSVCEEGPCYMPSAKTDGAVNASVAFGDRSATQEVPLKIGR